MGKKEYMIYPFLPFGTLTFAISLISLGFAKCMILQLGIEGFKDVSKILGIFGYIGIVENIKKELRINLVL